MSTVLIAVDDLNLVHDLESLIAEMQGVDVLGTASDTREMRQMVARLKPQLVLIGERLGPEPVEEVMRDFLTQHPATAMIEIVANRTPQQVVRAMEAGARGVLASPLIFEEVSERVSRALEYAEQMARVLAGAEVQNRRKGSLVTVVGAKGGVGTTTLSVHLAADHLREHPSARVCVVDVDVEKGDLAAMLDIRQSVSIADVARVSRDLSANTVLDAVINHESGLHVLLAPTDVREAELVTADSVRAILEVLRREFDLVVVDGGGHVSPTQAAALELADVALVVTTADALAMRSFRKRAMAWESLGVRDEADVRILVNKVDRSAVFPVSAVPRLTVARVLESSIPYTPKALELASNDRDPRAVTEVAWWRLMTSIRRELGVESSPETGRGLQVGKKRRPKGRGATAVEPTAESGERALALAGRERGAVALEHAAILPLALFLALLGWQAAVVGLTTVYQSHAMSAAARTYSLTHDAGRAEAAARAAVPSAFSDVTVTASGSQVDVSMHVPGSLGSAARIMDRVSSTQTVVVER